MNKKEFKKIELEVVEYFQLEKINSNSLNRYMLDTDWGVYRFFFDYEDMKSIFGRFDMDSKFNSVPPRNDGGFIIVHYPNIYSGKMNFHGDEAVNEFINTFDRLITNNNSEVA
ncbi:MAG: hypothetical protein U9Q66_00425 [Patescibacteria group bacterium]|nr:hypothetical protein [Patescibacteria group bacterium]